MPFLVVSTLICIVFTALLGMGGLTITLALFVVANVGYQAGLQFYDALLPEVSTEENRGWIGGIGTGVIIGISRAVGETAPLVTIGALTFIAFLPPAPIITDPSFHLQPVKWLMSPFTVLPIQMFNWVSRPGEDFLRNAAAAGVVLMVATLGLNAVAILVRHRVRRRIKW
jgi:MFS-type transporter involved in bile tolerance (Atg22 family)